MWPQLFPITLIMLDCGAAIAYAAYDDWRRSIYWAATAVLTASMPE